MYEYLCGTLIEKNPFSVVIECCGVGYYVNAPLSTVEKLSKKGEKVKLLVHYAVSEDSARLFGFYSESERKLFRLLISISRIGPKIGLSALSTFPVKQLVEAIMNENVKLISSIPGLGKKSAQRLIMELKDKLDGFDNVGSSSFGNIPKALDVETALLTLGYSKNDISKVLNKIDIENLTLEKITKKAIQLLYTKR